MLDLYNGATQLGIQHQPQPQIQPPQLPQQSSYSSGQALKTGIMSMSMTGQQPQPQGQNIPSNMQNTHPHPHQLPPGHLQSQRGVMMASHQQPRAFPPGGPVGAGPGQGLMQNPTSNPNPNAATAPGLYPHGPPPAQGARRMPGGPGPGLSNPPPPAGGMMGVQMPIQHPHQTHSHMPQHGIPPNQQLPPHLNSQQQQQPQQPPHLTHQGQPPHLSQQINMNMNNALQHPPQTQGQPSNPGFPPGIAGQLRQGAPNARMLTGHGPPPGGGGGGQGGGDIGMGSMGIPAMGMGGLGIPVTMGRGQQHQLGSQTANGMNMPSVMGRGGPTAPGMAMMNLGMGVPQPPGQNQNQGIPHRAQLPQHQPPSSQGQPFGIGAQPRPPSSQQQPPNPNSVNPQQSNQQTPLSYNPAHIQQPGHIHTPVPPNPAGNPNPNHLNTGAPSPSRPPTAPGTPGRNVNMGMMNALRAQGQQAGQTSTGTQPAQSQGQLQRSAPGTGAGPNDIMHSFAQLQQQHQHRQMMMGMTGMGAGMNEFPAGPSTGAGGTGGRVGMQHTSGVFIPDPNAHASNFSGTSVPGPNVAAAAAHNQIPNPNQSGGPLINSSPFTTIPHHQPGQAHHVQGSQHQQHPGSVGLGPGVMHMGQHMGQQQQQQQRQQQHSPHPPTPHRGTPTPGHPPGVQHGGPHPHPSQSHGPHGQLHVQHSQLSGTSASSTPNANNHAPTTAGNGMGSGPSSVMIPHPNAGPGTSNTPGGPGPGGRNPPNRMGIGGNMNVGTNMGTPMNMGMMFGGSTSSDHGEGQGQGQMRGQTPSANVNQGRSTPTVNQSPRQSQQVPAPGQGPGGHSLPTTRPPSGHPHSAPNPNIIPHAAQSGSASVGMSRGASAGPSGAPHPLPNMGPGPHAPGAPNATNTLTSPQVRRTSLPPGAVGEASAIGPPGVPTAGSSGLPPHGPVVRPPLQFPSVVGAGQGLVRVLGFSGAMGAESEERLTRNHWNKLVNEYFAPHSSWKLTLWRDNDRREAKLFEISPDVIAMFFVVSSQAGVKSMNFVLDNVQERPIHWGVSIVECPEARWIWKFRDGHTVVLRGAFSAQVTAYHNPASAAGNGGAGGTNTMNGPPGVNTASNPNSMNGPMPGTPGSTGTPHSPHAQTQPPPPPNPPHSQPHVLKFDLMTFDSFVHDRLLDLNCIFGLRIPYSSSSLSLTTGNGSMTDSPHTQGLKTTPSTTTQGSPDIAPASTSSSGSNPASGSNLGLNSGPGMVVNVKTEEHHGQGQGLMQGHITHTYSQGQAMSGSSPGSSNGGSGGVAFEERLVIEQAVLPAEPINAFGIPQASMRCLELAESVGHMTELFQFCRERNMGPTEALQVLANQIKSQYGLGQGQINVMGGGMGQMGTASGQGGMMGRQETRNPASSSLGPGGQGQLSQPYGIPAGVFGPPSTHYTGAPPFPLHGQTPGQGLPQHQSQVQPGPFQSQSQPHTPQSAQHTPQMAQLTKPLGQLTPQSQNQIIQNPTVSRSPGQMPTQPPAPKNPGSGTTNQNTGGTVKTGSAPGAGSNAMKRKAPDTSTPAMTQNDPSQPPAKRVTRRRSKAG